MTEPDATSADTDATDTDATDTDATDTDVTGADNGTAEVRDTRTSWCGPVLAGAAVVPAQGRGTRAAAPRSGAGPGRDTPPRQATTGAVREPARGAAAATTRPGGGQVTLAVVGAGLRGQSYAQLATADGGARVVAVAEPDPVRRHAFAVRYGIPTSATFTSWAELAVAGRLADAAIIATQDRDHVEPAVALAGLGYHLLLEKPMAPTRPEAERIVAAVEAAGVVAAVCHVLRFTAYTRALVDVIRSGRLGTVVNVQHLEPVGWWHYAHAYVRGNWSNEDTSGPMLLTKSCHDLDWLTYLLDEVPDQVSSFGGLAHFHAGNRPAGAHERCGTCPVEPDCPYSATRLYLGCLGDAGREFWPLGAVTSVTTRDGVLDALREGRYGRCVYASDNNVVDHQVVALGYPSGRTATFTMTAFTPQQHRQTRLFGTHGAVEGDGRSLRVTEFRTGETTVIDTETAGDGTAGDAHGGGDGGLVAAFLSAVATGDQSRISSDVASSLLSHTLVWAAEHARRTGTVVDPLRWAASDGAPTAATRGDEVLAPSC